MKFDAEILQQINSQLSEIIEKAKELESEYADKIEAVHPVFRKSAQNLIHYLAFRDFKIDDLQHELHDHGLPGLSSIESHVMDNLLSIKTIINHLLNNQIVETIPGVVNIKDSRQLLKQNTELLFGYKSKKRRTRIMVTLPSFASEDHLFVNQLLELGMNSARINCAHDNTVVWEQMIANVEKGKEALKRDCKVMMDLGGPKLRTGEIKPGPQVIRIKPKKDDVGKVVTPAHVWFAPPNAELPKNIKGVAIPVSTEWLKEIKKHTVITFTDSRNKKCKITMVGKVEEGWLGLSNDSAYLTTGTPLISRRTKNRTGENIIKTGELLPLPQVIMLNVGDTLILDSLPIPGENAILNDDGTVKEPAHISCTLPEIFRDVKVGEPIYFDDGKIEGIIEMIEPQRLTINITYAKATGGKLKADKGINLPESELKISGLTEKDKEDLKFVTKFADAVNFSFVNGEKDVQELLTELENLESKLGIIFKIETQKGFKNLPLILLEGMKTYPIGVMVARGDLAVETGWKNFASIQEEILRICEAAHIPDVWATQVLESLSKKGVPSRAEITDAAMANRAECVMLNKGLYITKAVKMLDKILRRMQHFQKRRATLLPQLEDAKSLQISHKQFDI